MIRNHTLSRRKVAKSAVQGHRHCAVMFWSLLASITLMLATAPPVGAQMMDGMGGGSMRSGMQRGTSDNMSSSTQSAGGKQGSSGDKRNFRRVCSSCHELPDPRLHTVSQWPRVVNRMERYMSSSGMPLPDPRTMREIRRYLKEHAAKR